jgi:hypothetical protein
MKMLYGKIMGMRKLLKKIVFSEMVGKCNRREKKLYVRNQKGRKL